MKDSYVFAMMVRDLEMQKMGIIKQISALKEYEKMLTERIEALEDRRKDSEIYENVPPRDPNRVPNPFAEPWELEAIRKAMNDRRQENERMIEAMNVNLTPGTEDWEKMVDTHRGDG